MDTHAPVSGLRHALHHAHEAKPAKKTEKEKDAKSTDSSDSCCTRVWNAVKSALVALVYYITFCQIDLSRNKQLFKGAPSVNCISSLPKKDDAKAQGTFDAEIVKQLTEAVKASGIEKKEHKAATKFFTDNRFVAEIHQVLVAAFEGGLKPLEYRLTVSKDEHVVSVELFAPEELDTDKLPTFEASSKKLKEVVSASKWGKAGQVTVTVGEGKDAKDTKVKCKTCTVEFNRDALPQTAEEKKAETTERAERGALENLEGARDFFNQLAVLGEYVTARWTAAEAARNNGDLNAAFQAVLVIEREQEGGEDRSAELLQDIENYKSFAGTDADTAKTKAAKAAKAEAARILSTAQALALEINDKSAKIRQIVAQVKDVVETTRQRREREAAERQRQEEAAAAARQVFATEAVARWGASIKAALTQTDYADRELNPKTLTAFATVLAKFENELGLKITPEALVGYPTERFPNPDKDGVPQPETVIKSGFALCFAQDAVPTDAVGLEAKRLFDGIISTQLLGLGRYQTSAKVNPPLWRNNLTQDPQRHNCSWSFSFENSNASFVSKTAVTG